MNPKSSIWYSMVLSSALLLTLLFLLPISATADIYKYYDDSGGINVTNDYNSVPERYRAGMTVVRESDLQKKAREREKQVRDERRPKKPQQNAAPSQVLPALSESKSETVFGKTTGPVSTGRKLGWLERQLPFLKICGIIILFLGAAVLVGRVLSSFVPRTLATVIRICLFLGVAVYVFNAFSERISKAFEVMKSETEVVQKAVDKRSERIEKQATER